VFADLGGASLLPGFVDAHAHHHPALDQDVFAVDDTGTVVPVGTIGGGNTVYQAS
jgi:predicted amidohydrolase YtcJ